MARFALLFQAQQIGKRAGETPTDGQRVEWVGRPSQTLMKACTSPSPELNIRSVPWRDINLFRPMFPEINPHALTQAFTSSHDTPRQRNLGRLLSAAKQVESAILKQLHHLFFFFLFPFLIPLLIWASRLRVYLSRFPSNPIKRGSRGAVTAKHVSAGADGKEASRQIKAKRSLNLLITQRRCHW